MVDNMKRFAGKKFENKLDCQKKTELAGDGTFCS